MKQVLRTEEDLYEEYVNLYNNTPSLDAFEDFDETWKMFKFKKGLAVHYVDLDTCKKIIPMDTSLVGTGNFYDRNRQFYLIPNDINGTIISFVLRGLKHDYVDYKGLSKRKPFFGLSTFLDFKYNKPIILTEGAKDCISLQRYYPYCLSLLGSGITKSNLDILRRLSSKFILAYDNDVTGIRQSASDAVLLKNNKLNAIILQCKKKDFGMCLEENFVEDIEEAINKFPKFRLRG